MDNLFRLVVFFFFFRFSFFTPLYALTIPTQFRVFFMVSQKMPKAECLDKLKVFELSYACKK